MKMKAEILHAPTWHHPRCNRSVFLKTIEHITSLVTNPIETMDLTHSGLAFDTTSPRGNCNNECDVEKENRDLKLRLKEMEQVKRALDDMLSEEHTKMMFRDLEIKHLKVQNAELRNKLEDKEDKIKVLTGKAMRLQAALHKKNAECNRVLHYAMASLTNQISEMINEKTSMLEELQRNKQDNSINSRADGAEDVGGVAAKEASLMPKS